MLSSVLSIIRSVHLDYTNNKNSVGCFSLLQFSWIFLLLLNSILFFQNVGLQGNTYISSHSFLACLHNISFEGIYIVEIPFLFSIQVFATVGLQSNRLAFLFSALLSDLQKSGVESFSFLLVPRIFLFSWTFLVTFKSRLTNYHGSSRCIHLLQNSWTII